VAVRHASVRTNVGTWSGSKTLASSTGVAGPATVIGIDWFGVSRSDATQHWSACDWLGWWCDSELCEEPSCIGHVSLSAQQAMRASGVGVTAAQRPTGPAVSIRPSDAA